MRARDYSIKVGRFVSVDPLGAVANDGNLLTYSENDAINRRDPLGLQSEPGGLLGQILWEGTGIPGSAGKPPNDPNDILKEILKKIIEETRKQQQEEHKPQDPEGLPSDDPRLNGSPDEVENGIDEETERQVEDAGTEVWLLLGGTINPPDTPPPAQTDGNYPGDTTGEFDFGGVENDQTIANLDGYLTSFSENNTDSFGYETGSWESTDTYYSFVTGDTEATEDNSYYGWGGGYGYDSSFATDAARVPQADQQWIITGSSATSDASAAALRTAASNALPLVERNDFANTYNADGSLASQVEQQYNAAGSLAYVRTLEYGGGSVTSDTVTDEINDFAITTQYGTGAEPSLSTTTYPDGFTITTNYGSNGQPTLSVSGFPGGATTTTTYGPHGDPTSPLPTDPNGGAAAGNDDWPDVGGLHFPLLPSSGNGNLVATGLSATATAGSTFIGQVASFTGTDTNPGDYTANIYWGDGTVSSGTISAIGSGDFSIVGSHIYGRSGSYSIGTRMTDTKGDEALANTPALVIPSLYQSTVAVSQPDLMAGTTTSVTLTARDANGNPEAGGGLGVAFALGGGSASGTFSAVTANGDGTYTATFTATANGTNTIIATVGNQRVSSPAPSITVPSQPAVMNVLVSSTDWNSTFLSYLASLSIQNVGGYSIPVGSGSQLATLPWGNINEIEVVFSENVMVDKSDLALSGVNVSNYDIAHSTFAYDSTTFTATWTLPQTIGVDKLLLQLNADGSNPIEDSAGNRLDGDWTNPTDTTDVSGSVYPSGNGTAGGDFLFRFNVLPGDGNQDGAVDGYDLGEVVGNYTKSGKTWADGDFTGDGTVDGYDLGVLEGDYTKTLPSGEPAAGSFPADASLAAVAPMALNSEVVITASGAMVDTPPMTAVVSPAPDGSPGAATLAVVLPQTVCTRPLALAVKTVASALPSGLPAAAAGIPSLVDMLGAAAGLSSSAEYTVGQANRGTRAGMLTMALGSDVDSEGQGDTLLTGTWGASFLEGERSTIAEQMIRPNLGSALAQQAQVRDAVLEQEFSASSPGEWSWLSDVANAFGSRAGGLDFRTNALDDVLAAYDGA